MADMWVPELLWRVLMSNTLSLCVLATVIDLLVNGTLLSLVVPCLCFLYGFLEHPRPSRGFWLLVFGFLDLAVCIKFLFQLDGKPMFIAKEASKPVWNLKTSVGLLDPLVLISLLNA